MFYKATRKSIDALDEGLSTVVQHEGKIYSIEVKAEENLRSKSLRAFSERYGEVNPRRFSLSGMRNEEWMKNVPLYAIGNLGIWS